MFDKDNSGTIERDEVKQILQGEDAKNHVTDEMIEELIQDIDKDGDGNISFEEFRDMMARCKETQDCSAKHYFDEKEEA